MKTKIYLFFAALMLTFAATTSNAKAGIIVAGTTTTVSYGKNDIANMTVAQREARIAEIKQRVTEIRAMDKSHLTSNEKKELRTELKNMRKEANAMSAANGGGGIYLSVGAIIIIILLLILILH